MAEVINFLQIWCIKYQLPFIIKAISLPVLLLSCLNSQIKLVDFAKEVQ